VNTPLPNGTLIENQAELRSDQTQPVAIGPVEHPVSSATDIALAKSVDRTVLDVPVDGTKLRYALRLSNTGNENATNVAITDAPPAGTTLHAIDTPPPGVTVECDAGSGFAACPADLSGVTEIRWTAAELTTSTPIEVGFDVNVVLPVESGTEIPNTAAYTTDQTPPGTSNEVTTTVLTAASLAIDKTGPATVGAGDEITYTVAVRNDGPATATSVTMRDNLPAGTRFVSASPECDRSGRRVTCALGTLAPGETREVKITIRTRPRQADQTLVNTASATSAKSPTPVTDEVTTVVGPLVDLSLEKTGPSQVDAGDTASFELKVSNAGPSTAENVVVTDDVPAELTPTSAKPSQGDCEITRQTVTCELGSLAAGESATINVATSVSESASGTIVNRATATTSTPDPDGPADADHPVTVIGKPTPSGGGGNVNPSPAPAPTPPPAARADLRIAKEALTRRSVFVGATVRYRITASNAGNAPAPGVVVTDQPQEGLRPLTAQTANGRCVINNRRVDCQVGTLQPGASVTVTVSARAEAAGTLNNVATASSTDDQAGEAVEDQAAVQAVAQRTSARLVKRAERRVPVGRRNPAFTGRRGKQPQRTKTVPVKRTDRIAPGTRLEYVIAYTVTGKSPAVNVRICDHLPPELVLISARGAAVKGRQACWTHSYMRPGTTRRVRLKVAVRSSTRGARVIRNVARSNSRNAGRQRSQATVHVGHRAVRRSGGLTG
jgi:uncharacterized repeat protein (TIGR01451 family)